MRVVAPIATVFLLLGCQANEPTPLDEFDNDLAALRDSVPPDDRHSHANPEEVQVRHAKLELHVDFPARVIRGKATLRLHRRKRSAPLRLDTVGLDIRSVEANGQPLEWRREDSDTLIGAALRIRLPRGVDEVTIDYATGVDAAALQWLEPEQTDGGDKPFLFTQGQPIMTRSWIPLQDSPGIRITWEASVHVDPALGVVAVMSAPERSSSGDGWFRFRMDRPIPPYLIALAVGELENRAISPRCSVWAEPGVVDAAANEFADAERMIAACEEMYGPYRWGRQDILVLPPAFPFGGMENPCMSFVTPTILAGDRSLVALIAHELSHAWSGNLVSNATWRDFWLNVGFTVYIEQRIIEQLFGVERARMETILGLRELARQFRRLPEDDQRLHIDLAGRDPDAAITAVPYDKGAAFLRRIERDVGRNRFDEFLAHWFKSHEFQSVTTYDFLDFLDKELPEIATRIDVDAWVNGPGIPDELTPSSEAFERVDAARATWLAGGPARAIDASSWATTHWQHFLAELPENLSVDRIAELDAAFDMAGVRNCEIECAWLQLAIRGGYDKADARVEEFLLSVGRRKLLRPLYRELMKTADGQQRAKAIYSRARPRYHTVSRRQIDDIVDWE